MYYSETVYLFLAESVVLVSVYWGHSEANDGGGNKVIWLCQLQLKL